MKESLILTLEKKAEREETYRSKILEEKLESIAFPFFVLLFPCIIEFFKSSNY